MRSKRLLLVVSLGNAKDDRGSSPYRAFIDFCEANNVSYHLGVWRSPDPSLRAVSSTRMKSSLKPDSISSLAPCLVRFLLV
jgi:hypothetical protein